MANTLCRPWCSDITRTWLKLPSQPQNLNQPRRQSMSKYVLIFLLFVASVRADVIVRQIGGSTMYVFTCGEVKGQVDVGKTITVRYWLRVTREGRARFILM